jgi:uroporphyrin-3 C-methyltransferase
MCTKGIFRCSEEWIWLASVVLWAEHGFIWVNTDISEIENEISDIPLEDEKPPRKGSAMAFLAFVFALVALAGSAWMWWQDQAALEEGAEKAFIEIARLERADSEHSLKLKQLRDEIGSLPTDDKSGEIAALQRRLETGVAEVDRLEQSLNEQLALSRTLQAAAEAMQGRLLAAEAALSGMASRELDAGGELDLAEVDYLLRLANERLKLFSDPVAADQVLELADMHLAALDNPMYLGVRQDIAEARRSLAELSLPDYFAISNDLDTIQQSITGLPFPGEEDVPAEQETVTEEGWWGRVKSVFSSLVTVRRSTAEENDRISLEDKDYIRQRLWLQLEIAHLSLMRRDQQAFRNSLARVRETLSAWFDQSNDSYQAVTASLDRLSGLEVQVEVPDISPPWATLRLIREGSRGPAPAVPAEVPQSDEQSDPGVPDNESTAGEEQG